jgi:hypothetical protein
MIVFLELRINMTRIAFSMQTRLSVAINGLQKSFLVAAYAVSRLFRKGVEVVVLKYMEKGNSTFDPG